MLKSDILLYHVPEIDVNYKDQMIIGDVIMTSLLS